MFSVALLLLLAAGCVKCEQLTQPASVTVQPGQHLTITCQVSYSVGNYWTAWIRQPAGKGLEWIIYGCAGCTTYTKESLKTKFSNSFDSSANTATLNGQNMQPEDSAVYYCARVYSSSYWAFDYWGKGTTVSVTSAASTPPTVFPLMQCGSVTGNAVTLGCLATGFSPSSLTYTWTKDGAAITDFIQYPPTQKNNVYSAISQLRVSRQDWEGNHIFKCAATNAAGATETNVTQPQVVYQEPTIKVFASDGAEEAFFSCFAKEFSPKTHDFKWLRNDEEIPNEKKSEIKTPSQETKKENGVRLYSAASLLIVPSNMWTDGDKITCVMEGKGEGGIPMNWNSSVTFEAISTDADKGCPKADVGIEIHNPDVKDLFEKGKGRIVCEVRINSPVGEKIYWEDERGNDIVGASITIQKGQRGPFKLPLDISFDEWSSGKKPTCAVLHSRVVEPFRKTFDRNIGKPTQRPSVFMLPPLEHTKKNTVTLTCYLKDFYPREVFVSWVVDDEEPDSEYESHQTEPIESKGSYYAYSHLTVSLDKWKKDGSEYGCVVNHESLINATSCNNRAIVRSIGYRSFENTNMVNLNMNTPETCKAQ